MGGVGGGGYSGFQVTGMLKWGQQSKPKRIPRAIKTPPKNPWGFQQNPQKSMDQKLTHKKSHAVLPSLKIFQKTLKYGVKRCTLFRTTRAEWAGTTKNLQIVLNTPKKSLLKSSNRYPKKYLPYFPCQKNPRIENFKPKISFNHPRHLKTEVPDHPRRPLLPWEQRSFAF